MRFERFVLLIFTVLNDGFFVVSFTKLCIQPSVIFDERLYRAIKHNFLRQNHISIPL